jgi:hypothetical protein
MLSYDHGGQITKFTMYMVYLQFWGGALTLTLYSIGDCTHGLTELPLLQLRSHDLHAQWGADIHIPINIGPFALRQHL